ncbi:MAG: serine/threonine-protein kinase [Cyanobacteria bacterium P01_A01_bin.37]
MSVVGQSSVTAQDNRVPKIAVPHIGALVGGRYRVTCRLAEGTFGHTYLAKDTHLPNNPECVIKQLKLQADDKAMSMARRLFETEARTLYRLGAHDQIPHLLAHFEQKDEFFLSQEFIDGYPISDELSPDRPWADTSVVRLIREILEVLVFVHGERVIHRDIKPSNLIRRKRDGRVVLIDFGAVKEVTTRFLSQTAGETDYTIAIGTFGYIPKEQLGGRPRFSSDIFAVGMIAVQALTGVHPNELVEDEHTAELQWRDRLTAPIQPEFAAIIDRMIRYDFRERYSNAESALKAIEALPVTFREAVSAPPWHVSSSREMSLPPTDAFNSHLVESNVSTFEQILSQPSASSHVLSATALEGTHLELNAGLGAASAQVPAEPSTFPLGHTQMTEVVAPSFSGTHTEPIHDNRYSNLSKNIDTSDNIAAPPSAHPSRTQTDFTSWKERVLFATGSAEHWLARSWRMVAIIGGTSLTLMLTRGMVASVGVQPANHLRAETVQNALPAAERLRFSIQSDVSESPAESTNAESQAVNVSDILATADIERESGQYQEAMDFYHQVLGTAPDNVDALWGKCATLNAQQQFEMASSVCYDVLAINPDHAQALWSSAEANEKLGNHEKAAEERSRALAIDPNIAASL